MSVLYEFQKDRIKDSIIKRVKVKNAVNTGYFPYHGRLENVKNLIQFLILPDKYQFPTDNLFVYLKGRIVRCQKWGIDEIRFSGFVSRSDY